MSVHLLLKQTIGFIGTIWENLDCQDARNQIISSLQYRSQGIKRRHSHLNCPQKLDKNSTQKLFKQPKGLAVCELQAAGPLVLRVRGADKNLDSHRALERSPFVYSYEKKSIALKVFHQTNSVSETIRILGYPTRRQLYSWIDDENLPSKERKPLPRIANSPEHPKKSATRC